MKNQINKIDGKQKIQKRKMSLNVITNHGGQQKLRDDQKKLKMSCFFSKYMNCTYDFAQLKHIIEYKKNIGYFQCNLRNGERI